MGLVGPAPGLGGLGGLGIATAGATVLVGSGPPSAGGRGHCKQGSAWTGSPL